MAKPRLSTGRIPFQLGLNTSVAPVAPIIHACATLTQETKPIAALLFVVKPIASIVQRPC